MDSATGFTVASLIRQQARACEKALLGHYPKRAFSLMKKQSEEAQSHLMYRRFMR
jgi:hypothetical protein